MSYSNSEAAKAMTHHLARLGYKSIALCTLKDTPAPPNASVAMPTPWPSWALWLIDQGVTAMMVASGQGFIRTAAGAALADFKRIMVRA